MNSLARKYDTASTGERESLIVQHIPYVRQVLNSLTLYVTDHDELENLISAGTLGLVQAANSFDKQKGISFRSFAYSRIRGAILDELRKKSLIPQRVMEWITQIKRIKHQLEPPVTPERLATETGLTLDQIEQALEATRFMSTTDWDDLHSVIHSSWSESPLSPSYQSEREEMKQLIASGIKQLNDRERIVLTLYFAEELTLKEIGEVIELSESRTSRILSTAKYRLAEFLRSKME